MDEGEGRSERPASAEGQPHGAPDQPKEEEVEVDLTGRSLKDDEAIMRVLQVIDQDRRGSLVERLENAASRSPYPGKISANTLIIFMRKDLRLPEADLKSLAEVTKIDQLS